MYWPEDGIVDMQTAVGPQIGVYSGQYLRIAGPHIPPAPDNLQDGLRLFLSGELVRTRVADDTEIRIRRNGIGILFNRIDRFFISQYVDIIIDTSITYWCS